MNATILVGSRGSALALRQAQAVAQQIASQYPNLRLEIVPIKTKGDMVLDRPLADIGDKGLFVKELQQALLEGAIDMAVHSLKDLPNEGPPGVLLGGVSPREDVRDVLIAPSEGALEDLPQGARIGTSSLRRSAQLRHYRGDLSILDLRGNLDTRLRKAEEGLYDAIVVAAAGVHRLGLQERITQYIPVEICVPAPGQGAMAVEVREGDDRVREIVAAVSDPGAYRCTGAERAFLGRLGGGCRVPIGAYAQEVEGQLALEGMVATPDGSQLVRSRLQGPPERWQELGEELAERVLELGGGEILQQIWTPWRV